MNAVLRRADGAVISISQYDAFCGQLGDTYLEDVTVRGVQGAIAALGVGACISAPDAAPCLVRPYTGALYPDGRSLLFKVGDVGVFISSNLAGSDALVALAESAALVPPSPGLGPLFERFRGRVVKVFSAEKVRILDDGHRRVVRLAGVRAPGAGQCWAPESKRLATRMMQGRDLWFEADPRVRRRYWLFRSYFGGGDLPFRDPLNRKLIDAGAVLAAPGTWRHTSRRDESSARISKRGVWGPKCKGRFSTRPAPASATPSPSVRAPSPHRRPARSDRYNCDNFPLPDGTTAQQYLQLYPDDPSVLDGNHNGKACEGS